MTIEQKEVIRQYLSQLNGFELKELRDQVDEQLEDLYWCDENFWMREQTDSYIYITRYKDGSYHYDYLGKQAYKRYSEDENCIQIDYKTKDLFPKMGTLMVKGI